MVNWDAVGAIAELLGSLAVVVSFLYLAAQIRQSSKAAKSTATNHTRSAVTDVLGVISGSSEATRVYTIGMMDPDSLEIHERVRFDLIIFQQLRAVETIFLGYREGMVAEELWLGQWRGCIFILATKGGRESWNRQKHFVSESFMEWVDEQFRNLENN